MISSGPFILTANESMAFTDPTWTQPCAEKVQVQNSSGFLIQASIGGVQYLIQPYTASTVPTAKTPYLNIKTIVAQGSFGALISFSWLQKNEDPPMSDGPLFPGNTQSLGLLSAVGAFTFAPNVGGSSFNVNLLPLPPLGFVYSLFSIAIATTFAPTGDVTTFQLEGVPAIGAPVLLWFWPGAGGNFIPPQLFLVNGVTTSDAVWSEAIAGSNTDTDSGILTLRYDLFPQPIG